MVCTKHFAFKASTHNLVLYGILRFSSEPQFDGGVTELRRDSEFLFVVLSVCLFMQSGVHIFFVEKNCIAVP